ncbi:MAG: tRNA pseudouridine(55) synthase TruB [Acidobacteriota bacterium]
MKRTETVPPDSEAPIGSTRAAGGLLIVDKPVGPTSHDIVSVARRALSIRKVGHTGTLDPLASGVLVLVLGRATRLARFISGHDKTYSGSGQLGWSTDTFDATGRPLGEAADVSGIGRSELAAAAGHLTGRILQSPPPFSACKVDGERLYRRARRGETVAAPAREVLVHRFEIDTDGDGRFTFTCRVSAGTYIRSLVNDLGAALGCGAHLTTLRRTDVGGVFTVARALAADRLRRTDGPGPLGDAFVPMDRIPLGLPVVEVPPGSLSDLSHGRPFTGVPAPGASPGPLWQARSADGRLLALVGPETVAGTFRPRTVFFPPPADPAGFTPSS